MCRNGRQLVRKRKPRKPLVRSFRRLHRRSLGTLHVLRAITQLLLRKNLRKVKRELRQKPKLGQKRKLKQKLKLEKMKDNQEKMKDELKTVSLGTSKINYLDPRITIAWCKRHEVPPPTVFTRALIEKFNWSMEVEPTFDF